ncbi:MAG: ornithine carbamoyltransferase [Acidobacteria bacterium]|nr:ornithine carbamoyltransferase [Acidobacteriota bacterium]MDW7983442.1 ornithine carbamoyltransferase [Acidobacteriota bacterium]
MTAKVRHFLDTDDVSIETLRGLLQLAQAVKQAPERYAHELDGRVLGMVFQKPSTRTRVSFEVAMLQMGGHALYFNAQDLQLGRGETVADTARVLSRYVDGIVARVFAHADVVTLARYASVPVINGLSDYLHPCQVLADLLTLWEKKGRLEGLRLAYVGDGNNVCHSLLLAGSRLGLHLRVATPPGFEPHPEVVDRARSYARSSGGRVLWTSDPGEAVAGADAVYTDVWASMGQEHERAYRVQVFRPYQVNATLMGQARPDVIFMHCLPAHRGEEVTDDVIDGPASVVWDQAENRLHTQKALLLWLFHRVTL